MNISITNQQLATILAALRYWQQELDDIASDPSEDNWIADSQHFTDVEPLTSEEIDALCQQINCGDDKPSITIGVHGGCVQWYAPSVPMNVTVLDYDGVLADSNGIDSQNDHYLLLQPPTADYAIWGYPNGTMFNS